MCIKLYFCVFVFYGDCETSELCLCVFPVWASLCFDIPMQIVKHRGGANTGKSPSCCFVTLLGHRLRHTGGLSTVPSIKLEQNFKD